MVARGRSRSQLIDAGFDWDGIDPDFDDPTMFMECLRALARDGHLVTPDASLWTYDPDPSAPADRLARQWRERHEGRQRNVDLRLLEELDRRRARLYDASVARRERARFLAKQACRWRSPHLVEMSWWHTPHLEQLDGAALAECLEVERRDELCRLYRGREFV
jgi:hypothetical protein